jgi:hypothetical protein
MKLGHGRRGCGPSVETSRSRGVVSRNVGPAMALACVSLLCVTSTAFGATRLNRARFKAIDALFIAYLPIDSNRFTSSDIASLDRACRRLDPADELLGAMRPGCLLMVRTARRSATLYACAKASSPSHTCRKAAKALRTSWQKLANRQAAENRAINRVVSAGPCRDVLRTSADDIEALDLLTATLREFERAMTSPGRPDLSAFQRLISKLQKATGTFTEARPRRERFREACR